MVPASRTVEDQGMGNVIRREEMQRALAHRDRHGLTYRKAGEECGVSEHTLSWWAWRLRKERREQTSFVEVEVAESHAAGGLEIQAPSGHVVRIPEDFDAAVLQRVLEVLAAC